MWVAEHNTLYLVENIIIPSSGYRTHTNHVHNLTLSLVLRPPIKYNHKNFHSTSYNFHVAPLNIGISGAFEALSYKPLFPLTLYKY